MAVDVNVLRTRSTIVIILMGFLALFIYLLLTYVHTSHHSHANPQPPSVVPLPDLEVHQSFAVSHYLNNNNNISFNNNSNLASSVMKSKAIFVMGDASVDCGDNALFYPLIRRNMSLFPCSNDSASSLIPHILAKKMGLPSIPTFYEQNGTLEGILNGLNYGSAHATILPSPNTPNFQSLNQQLRQAFETIQLLQLQLGEERAQSFVNSSVFYLSLGKDDYINFLFENSSLSTGYNGDAQLVSRLLVDEMTNAFKDLYDAGARKIVGMGIYPLGCAPRAVVNWYFMTGRNRRRLRTCVNEINQLILHHNQLLNDHIIDLNLEFADAQFVFCDVYQGIMQIMDNALFYGIEDVRGACCGRGWHGAGMGCQSLEMACNQSSSHVWWDFYNPSEAVNSLIADSVWSGQPLGEICHPLNIQRLVSI